MQKPEAAINVKDLTVKYGQKTVLQDISLSIPQGKLVGIIGPNGAGKSTFLKALMGLIPIKQGNIAVLGKSIAQVRKEVAYVPQRESIDWDFPASVQEIVMMGRYVHKGLFKKIQIEDKRIVQEALEKVGMEKLASRQIGALSGGQQQRTFIARALAQKAAIYLLDEPFAGLDIPTETQLIELLKDLCKQGHTICLVHHDLFSVSAYFDWVILLNEQLIAAGNVEDTFTAAILEKTYGRKIAIL